MEKKIIRCRLCAVTSTNMIAPSSREWKELNIKVKVNLCLRIEINEDDKLPKNVCVLCIDKLDQYYEFFTKCGEVQEVLRNIYKYENECNAKPEWSVESGDICDEQAQNGTRGVTPEFHTSDIKHGIMNENQRVSFKHTKHVKKFKNNIGKNNTKTYDMPKSDDVAKKVKSICRRFTPSYILNCMECGKNIVSPKIFRQHYLQIHEKDPVYSCRWCTNIYNSYPSMARHVKFFHGKPKNYCCNNCGKWFATKPLLRSHMHVHIEVRPYACNLCSKTFKQPIGLTVHLKNVHQPKQEKPVFICDKCEKIFTTKHSVEQHLRIHAGLMDSVCDVCGKSYVLRSSLRHHMLSHSEPTYPCTVCGSKFRSPSILKKHYMVHGTIKPVQCDVCGKQFRSRSALKDHSGIHTGEKSYVCNVCNKSFRFRNVLAIHQRQHTGEKPYKCDVCGRTFVSWTNWYKHLSRRHPGTYEPTAPSKSHLKQKEQPTDTVKEKQNQPNSDDTSFTYLENPTQDLSSDFSQPIMGIPLCYPQVASTLEISDFKQFY